MDGIRIVVKGVVHETGEEYQVTSEMIRDFVGGMTGSMTWASHHVIEAAYAGAIVHSVKIERYEREDIA